MTPSPSHQHTNQAQCPGCEFVMNRFPFFHAGLREWVRFVRSNNPDAHVSWAGRGSVDQEEFFRRGSSKAHWKESAHNYNAAVDWFRLTDQGASWGEPWFRIVIGSAVRAHNALPESKFLIKWYGADGAPYKEMPHCEVDGWKKMNFPLVE